MEQTDTSIDAVILYVDATDPEWQKRYAQETKQLKGENNCRFRNWDNLQYLFRGIEKNMPWVQRVHLVIQSESQIPKWLNTDNDKLHIVYHDDYIPSVLLPTFNSNTIELFMHRISGIAQRFIVFNDDVFPVSTLEPDNFFEGFKARVSQHKGFWRGDGQYERMIRNNIELLKRYFPHHRGFYPEHITHNILKSSMEEIVEKVLPDIIARHKDSELRADSNLTIQMVCDYMILTGQVVPPNIFGVEVNLTDERRKICPQGEIICFNDSENVRTDFLRLKCLVNTYLQKKLPEKSSFEK